MNRPPYPSDVSDEEWAFVAPYLSPLPQTAAQLRHDLREVFNALRWMVHAECRGGCCPSTSQRGKRRINRPGDGWPRAVSKPSSMSPQLPGRRCGAPDHQVECRAATPAMRYARI